MDAQKMSNVHPPAFLEIIREIVLKVSKRNILWYISYKIYLE